MRNLKVAFFGYSWHPHGHLDSYMAQHVEAILDLGIDIDLYLGNYFTNRRGVIGLSSRISTSRLAFHIAQQHYDFALSFNNSLLMPKVVDALGCRAVSIIVDSQQHLFDHAEAGGYSAFDLDVAVAPIYRSLEHEIASAMPNVLTRFHFIPPATDPTSWRDARRDGMMATNNVSWIASLVGDHFLDQLSAHISRHNQFAGLLRECLAQISATGYLNGFKIRSDVIALCASLGWEVDFLEVHLQNIATNNDRTDVVEELSQRGLLLYGNDRWNKLLSHSRAVARSLMIGHRISSYLEQMDVYNTSKISINVPQIQAKTGMQYRILDVMASNALLLTKHIDDSDLDFIFGGDFPAPRFHNHEQLGKYVDHFLENESERIALVDECHALLGPEFSFRHRVRDYLMLSNPALPPEQWCSGFLGTLNAIPASTFTNWTGPR